MAIYSLSASSVGRSTHAVGTAGAHVSYITRSSAAVMVLAANMPHDPKMARAWLDEQEANDRKNARVVTKIMLALPAELNGYDRMQLVKGFAAEITLGKAPWLAAIHRPSDDGDERNFHAHVVIRDRDPDTGKTVCGMSDKGSVDRLRAAWERHVNAALDRAGVDARVDRRSLADQGIEREPQLHVGVAGTAIQREGRVSDRAEINANIVEMNSLARDRLELAKAERLLEAATAERLAREKEAAFQQFRAPREAERQAERERRAAEAETRQREYWEAAAQRRDAEAAAKAAQEQVAQELRERQRRADETAAREREAQAARERQRQADEAAARERAAQAAQELRERQRRADETAAREREAQEAHERQRRAVQQLMKPAQPKQPTLVQAAKATVQHRTEADLEEWRQKAKFVLESFIEQNPQLHSQTPGFIRVAVSREDFKPISAESSETARIVRHVLTDEQHQQVATFLGQKPSTFVKIQVTKLCEMLDLATNAKELTRLVKLVMAALASTVRALALAGRDAPDVGNRPAGRKGPGIGD